MYAAMSNLAKLLTIFSVLLTVSIPAQSLTVKDSLFQTMNKQKGKEKQKTTVQYIRRLIPEEMDSARMLLIQNEALQLDQDLLLRADYLNTWGL